VYECATVLLSLPFRDRDEGTAGRHPPFAALVGACKLMYDE